VSSRRAFAPAKVNLYLHVGPARADGFHPISSLMAFADLGDRVVAEPSEHFELAVDGPFARHAPLDEGNLVIRAVRALFGRFGREPPAVKLTLTKTLPAAAGLGGGSSDAAAVLLMFSGEVGLEAGDRALSETAGGLGSDVPACLLARPVIAEGRGEVLSNVRSWPDLPVVLLRPDAGSATGPVYAAFDASAGKGAADTPEIPTGLASPAEAAAFLAGCRNDLEAPAVSLEPVIGKALDALRGEPETLLARMSGSGSACFAICADRNAAQALARRLAAAHPRWWVKACRLGGAAG